MAEHPETFQPSAQTTRDPRLQTLGERLQGLQERLHALQVRLQTPQQHRGQARTEGRDL